MVLTDLIVIEPKVHEDLRGFFLESFHAARYKELGVDLSFPQDNHSYSKRGVLRGMHFQKGQAKLIYCPKGEIFDVAVDIRRGSKTFGKWQGFYLSGENHKQLYIPDGFAHGFCVISDEAHVMYKVSTHFDAKSEGGFLWNDPTAQIEWPIKDPILSERDRNARPLLEVI